MEAGITATGCRPLLFGACDRDCLRFSEQSANTRSCPRGVVVPPTTLDTFLREAQSMNGRSRGLLAATVCLLELGACTAPEEHTDLRPAGAPEVLTVLVSNSTDG